MLTSGTILQNRYRIISLLGQGGMGAVYKAWDLRLNVPVAVKEMVPQPGIDAQPLAGLRQQFYQEAQVLARLSHPNLVRVTDYFEEGGNAYLVMDFVEGQSLADLIVRQGSLPEAQVLEWARQLLDALAYCHGQGIIHRDIKPQNIIIRADGRPVLVDFGLVKLWDPRDPRTQTVMRGMGTPEYAPPEQYGITGHTDPRSDLYSLGATLYHALTGQAPPTAADRIANPGTLRPLQALNSRISSRTEQAVLKAMELNQGSRWPSAVEMAQGLGLPISTSYDFTLRLPIAVSSGMATSTPERENLFDRASFHRLPKWIWILGAIAALVVVSLFASRLSPWLREVQPLQTETPHAFLPTPTSSETQTATLQPIVTAIPVHTVAPGRTPGVTGTASLAPATPTALGITVTPYSAERSNVVFFREDFNGSEVDSSIWGIDIGFGKILIENGILVLSSQGKRYPYLWTLHNPFPSAGSFRIISRFRYSYVATCGVGIIFASYVEPVGLSQEEATEFEKRAELTGVTMGIWQDDTNGMQFWFHSEGERRFTPLGVSTVWSEMIIENHGEEYLAYLNDSLVYTSPPTRYRPINIWIGHPAELKADCLWSGLEIDFISIESFNR